MKKKCFGIFLSLCIICIITYKFTTPTYETLYKKILDSQTDENIYFSLYDFNKDQTPELIIIHSKEAIDTGNELEADEITVYSYLDNRLKKSFEMDNTNAYLYCQDEKLVLEYANSQGTPCEIYELKENKFEMMQSGYSDADGVHINNNYLTNEKYKTYSYDDAVCARTVLADNIEEFSFCKIDNRPY